MITVKKGDFGYDLVFWVKQREADPTADLLARDLSGFYTDPDLRMRLRVWARSAVAYALDGVCAKDAAVDLATGKCLYTVQSGDFDTGGEYNAELILWQGTWGAETYRERTETFMLRVIERSPDS